MVKKWNRRMVGPYGFYWVMEEEADGKLKELRERAEKAEAELAWWKKAVQEVGAKGHNTNPKKAGE